MSLNWTAFWYKFSSRSVLNKKKNLISETWDSHSSADVHSCLLGYDTM
jgi:hypothetical protein